jgi:hypothetical protein
LAAGLCLEGGAGGRRRKREGGCRRRQRRKRGRAGLLKQTGELGFCWFGAFWGLWRVDHHLKLLQNNQYTNKKFSKVSK